MATEREKLQEAHGLIKGRQFDAARLILLEIPHNETAQKWLAKLEEIAPTGTGTAPPVVAEAPIRPLGDAAPGGGWENNPAAPPPVIDAIPSAAPRAETLSVTIDLHFARYALAGIMGVLGLLMILGYFLLPWMDMTEGFLGMAAAFGEEFGADESQFQVTALELFIGQNDGENFVISFDEEMGGFADVRTIDRLLILIPVGGLVLIWLAWSYASGEIGRLTAASALAFTALLLLIAPWAWESASNDQLEQSLRDSMEVEMTEGDDDFALEFGMAFFGGFMNFYEDAYSTGEQKLMGLFAFLAALIALGLEIFDEMNKNQVSQVRTKRPAI